jgi:Phage derived protein Gp49-like (DUF891)
LNRQRLRRQFDAQGFAHPCNRVKAWLRVGAQGFVQRLAANACVLGNLGHAARARYVAQRCGQQAGAAVFEEAIYVLHCFQKKTQVTSRQDKAIAQARYRAVANLEKAKK